MSEICMIMAIGPENVIGKGSKLAWYSKNDFYHFKNLTKGYPCVFGNVTFYNLPKYPLKNRLNIVANIENDNTYVLTNENNGAWIETNSIEKALSYGTNYDKIFICGGKSVYKYCLEKGYIDTVYLTEISTLDQSLENDIITNKDEYVCFPIDLMEYLGHWNKEEICYTEGMVKEDCQCKFLKFTKPLQN